jgi:hypothetical protein
LSRSIDITGQRFGRLMALRLTEKGNTSRNQRWLFRCDCGNETEVDKHHVMRGATRSCGCLEKENRRQIAEQTAHGHARVGKRSREYATWSHMKYRCNNPNSKDYPDYGGRGTCHGITAPGARTLMIPGV